MKKVQLKTTSGLVQIYSYTVHVPHGRKFPSIHYGACSCRHSSPGLLAFELVTLRICVLFILQLASVNSVRWLNLQEYQSKKLMAENGILVQEFMVASSADEAQEIGCSFSKYSRISKIFQAWNTAIVTPFSPLEHHF